MTEERSKYLASISKEEIYIRRRICQLKGAISDDKYALNNGTYMKQLRKICIRENKIIIKALKKQLPVAKRIIPQVFNLNLNVYDCPVCGDRLSYGSEGYCASCGQKFR